MSKTRVFNQGFGYFIEVTFAEPEAETNRIWSIYQYMVHDGHKILYGLTNAYNKVEAEHELYRIIKNIWTGDECEWVEEAQDWIPKSELDSISKE